MLSGVALNTGVGNSYQPGLDYEGGTNKKTKSESESGTTAVPRSTAANKKPINDGDEGWFLSFTLSFMLSEVE